MLWFTAVAARLVRALPCLLLAASFSPLSTSSLSATTTAPPQPLPYTVSAVAGGGTTGATTVVTTFNPVAHTFTQGQNCSLMDSAHTAQDAVGDGCLATEVELTLASHTATANSSAVDSEGNLFIVDQNNELIRRVDAHTGIITTVAGTTAFTTTSNPKPNVTPCSSSDTAHHPTDAYGDGCLATEVALYAPEGIALDHQGNIWFTDFTLGSVREISKATGIITTVVNTTGNVGYNAGNANSAYGNNGTAQPVSAANGLLYRPFGLAFDQQGNLYIADNYNNVVDVVNLGNANLTLWGGSNPVTIGPNDIYTIAGSGCPYVSTAYTATITSSDYCGAAAYYGHSNGSGSPTTSVLDSPYQVAVDNSGNIYIADEYPYDVRVITASSGTITTFAGIPASHMATTATLPRGAASSTALGSIYGVATDPKGNVYIALYQSPLSLIARVDQATGEIYPIAGQYATATPAAGDNGVAQPGATYCATASDAIGDGCPATQATFWKPYQPVVDAAGNLYVTDLDNYLIRKISIGTQFPAVDINSSVTQNIEMHFGAGDTPSATAPFSIPSGSDFTLQGSPACGAANSDGTMDCVLTLKFTPTAAGIRTAPLTVTSTLGNVTTLSLTGIGNAAVLALDPGVQTTVASTNLTGVTSLALDYAGNVYATVPGVNGIARVTAAGAQSIVASTLNSGANAVAVDASGNIYATLSNASGSGSVVKIPATGASQVNLGSGFTSPSGIAVDASGNVYVADSSANTVSESLAGTGTQVTLPFSGLSGPTGLAVDSYGNLFVANTGDSNVLELPFGIDSPQVTLGSGLDSPSGLAIDPAGSLYIADTKNKRIVFIPNEGGTLNTNDQIAMITAGITSPTGITIASNGTAYVSDSYSGSIYSFNRSAAAINFGTVDTAIGNQAAETVASAADIISMGTESVVLGSQFVTTTGDAADFAIAPPLSSPIVGSTSFPAGYAVSLNPSFTPLSAVPLSAVYTFAAAGAPTLTLSGTGANPTDATITTIASTSPTWTYGQTVTENIAVTVNPGLPTPTGPVAVTVDTSSVVVASGTLNTAGAVTVSIPGLSAGQHTLYVTYKGDLNSLSSTASASVTLAPAPLAITINNVSKVFEAPVPTLTGVVTGVVNGDQIGVNYSTPAMATSPIGVYPITATLTGSAASNYVANVTAGSLTIIPASTVTTLSTSATSVNSSTPVTLSATVDSLTYIPAGLGPSGSVTFFNGATQIGTASLNSNGVASYVTTFAVEGQTTNNAVSAVYNGNQEFATSTSPGISIVSGVPTFAVTPAATSLTVAPGQSGLTTFTLKPAFGYSGTISFACTGAPATVSCSFSPSSITPNSAGTSSTIAVSFNTQQAGPLASNERPTPSLGAGPLGVSLATIPCLALLCGLRRRSRALRGYGLALLAAICLLGSGLGLSGCQSVPSISGTQAGSTPIAVVATGTIGGTSTVVQQFNVTLTVQ